MRAKLFLVLSVMLIVLSIAVTTMLWSPTPDRPASPVSSPQNTFLPYFAPDATGTQFTAQNHNLQAHFKAGQVTLTLTSGKIVTITFQGGDETRIPQGQGPLAATAHYYRGNTAQQWHENVPLYSQISYENLYPGIDLHYTFVDGQLKSEFILHPGANLEPIQIHYAGIEELKLEDETMHIMVNATTILDEVIPYAYESYNGMQRAVTARFYYIDSHTHGFRIVESLNPEATLTIDPELHYATYFGGTAGEGGLAIATDYDGNSYVSGNTRSPDLPVLHPISSYTNLVDIFIAKYDPQGHLIYATYYGGSGDETGNAIATDGYGNVYVTGSTHSPDLPVHNAWQSVFGGSEDAYVLKLNASGQLEWATYIGGPGATEANAIAVDRIGRVYIAGEVYDDNFPLLNPWRSVTYGDDEEDGFISILDAAGQLIYSTYISAPERDQLFTIAVDENGHVYAAGMTSSPDFPVQNAHQPGYGGGWEDCLILKLDPWNNILHFATFLGGWDREACIDIDFDLKGNIYVVGYTSSPNFPVINAHQPILKGDFDAFIAKFNSSGSIVHYATLMGGSAEDRGSGLITDHRGYSYIVGRTRSRDFPTTSDALQTIHGGGTRDGFIAVFDPAGTLHYSSYLGGTNSDSLQDIALDGSWIAHVTGGSSSDHLATENAYQSQRAGGTDTLMGRFAIIPTPTPTPTPTPYATTHIDSSGGALWLSYPKHLTLLRVPEGALSTRSKFELVYDGRTDNQGPLQGLNHFFALHVEQPQTLQGNIQLFLGYEETRGVIVDTLDLYRLDAGIWVTDSITTTEHGTRHILAWIDQPGTYGVLGKTNRLHLPLIMRE